MKDQSYSYLHTDSELTSGLDAEEFRGITRKRRQFTKKARSHPPPVLDRYNYVNRHSQKCVITAGEGEDTIPSVCVCMCVWGGGREGE